MEANVSGARSQSTVRGIIIGRTRRNFCAVDPARCRKCLTRSWPAHNSCDEKIIEQIESHVASE